MALIQDYFTATEFRTVTADTVSPFRYDDSDISRAQDEVITTLERWAKSAWPTLAASRGVSTTVDATPGQIDAVGGPFGNITIGLIAVGDQLRIERADGALFVDQYVTVTSVISQSSLVVTPDINLVTPASTNFCNVYKASATEAIGPRTITETFTDIEWAQITSSRTPFLSLLGDVTDSAGNVLIEVNVAIEGEAYVIDNDTGIMTFGSLNRNSRIYPGFIKISVPYSYGYTATPWAVKRPCIKAAKTLLDFDEKRGKVPQNTKRYETEHTTFEFGTSSGPVEPWPWDIPASNDIQGYWGKERATEFVIV